MLNKFSLVTQVLVVALFTTALLAQPSGRRGGGGFSSMMSGGGMTPDYMLRDLQKFKETFVLTEDQMMIVEQILRDYDESFREATEASQEGISGSFRSMRGTEDDPASQKRDELRQRSRDLRDKLDAARKLGDEADTAKMQEAIQSEMSAIRNEMNEDRTARWQSDERQTAFEEIALMIQDQLRLKRQMKNELEGDLVILLSEEQLALWPALQRQLIRDRLLPFGRLSGETVDVMALVDQQDFDEDTLNTLSPAIDEWDIQVATALTARDDYMVETQGVLMSAMSSMDTSAGLDVMKTQGTLAESVRTINDNAIGTIVLLLPVETSKAFDAEAKLRGYPRIYRTTQVERSYQAAQELEGLEEDILAAIVDLEVSLLSELAYANDHILSETHRWESQESLDRMNRFAQRMSGGSSERAVSPIREAEDARGIIEDSYLEQLKMLLTEEQIEALGGLETRKERSNNRDREGSGAGRNGEDGAGRGGFGGGREEFLKRFDKNGDGEINEDERNAIREYFRSNRGGGSPN
jgi:hypothetical protein